MSFPLVVSFYTDDPYYSNEVLGLKRTCQQFDMEYDIECLPSSGSWTANCAMKGPFLKRKMQQHNRPLLWLDADALVLQKPEMFDGFLYEFAAYWHKNVELISATLYFAPTVVSKTLLSMWAKLCEDDPGTWDQKSLQKAWERMGVAQPSTLRLHKGFCKTYNHSCDFPLYIQQNQASRRFKKLVNSGGKTK